MRSACAEARRAAPQIAISRGLTEGEEEGGGGHDILRVSFFRTFRRPFGWLLVPPSRSLAEGMGRKGRTRPLKGSSVGLGGVGGERAVESPRAGSGGAPGETRVLGQDRVASRPALLRPPGGAARNGASHSREAPPPFPLALPAALFVYLQIHAPAYLSPFYLLYCAHLLSAYLSVYI